MLRVEEKARATLNATINKAVEILNKKQMFMNLVARNKSVHNMPAKANLDIASFDRLSLALSKHPDIAAQLEKTNFRLGTDGLARQILTVLEKALNTKSPVRIIYFDNITEELSFRVIEPMLFETDNRNQVSLKAFCQLSNTIRSFWAVNVLWAELSDELSTLYNINQTKMREEYLIQLIISQTKDVFKKISFDRHGEIFIVIGIFIFILLILLGG